jgi:hypothetical protein
VEVFLRLVDGFKFLESQKVKLAGIAERSDVHTYSVAAFLIEKRNLGVFFESLFGEIRIRIDLEDALKPEAFGYLP